MKFGTLRITMADGRQREYPLELPSIVIGRADGNAIVIDDLSVARRHARAFIDSSRLMLEDLGSATGTYIDGERITPNTPSLVEATSEIRFGDVVARYEPPVEAEEPEPDALPDVTPVAPPLATGIGLKLAVGNEPLIPGSGGLTTEITIHNRGNVVDEFDIVVAGLPATWLMLSTPRIGLLPGTDATVILTIQPPRRSEAIAGDHPFDVTVTSQTTGRSATETGNLRILGFNGLVLTVEPPRGRRDFVLVAGNDGNVTETLALTGVDDEDAFDYTFGQDVLEVAPGREQRMPFRVKPRKRALFGRETIVPFNVMAKPEAGEAEAIPAIGQLVVHPPLEPLKRPILFSLVLIVLGIATFGVFLFSNDTGTKAASPEAAYAGVHMCDKGNQPKSAAAPASNANKASAQLGTTSDAIPAVAQTGPIIQQQQSASGGPYFAQNDPRWANVEYAKAGDPDFGPDWCGTTIAQCGCAMTSVTTMMALFNIVTMPDGQDLTPQTVNDWFNLNARKTARGWVSQGYIYGDVIWTAANQLSGEIAAKYPGTRTVRFARTGTGSDAEIKAELRAGRPIVLEVPGHWIAAVGLDGDTILINDPFYRDRKTLDAYAGKVKSSVLFEPSEDLSAVVITVPADTRIRVTDKQGRVVGTLDTSAPADAAKNAKSEIPGASYSTRQAWRDPTCVESAPPAGAGTNQIVLPGSKDDYKIEVLETTGGPTSVSIHTYDKNGQPTVQTIDNATGGVTAAVSFDPNSGKADVSIVGGKPTEEDSSARSAGNKTTQGQAAASPSPSPSASATASPSATATAAGGLTTTTLSVSVPAGAKEVSVGTQNGFSVGDLVRISPGQANEEDNTITAFGSFIFATPLKFAHSAGEPVVRLGGAPPGTGGTGGTGGGGQGPPKTEISPPDSVGLNCSVVYSDSPKNATLVCSTVIGGVFTTTRWTVDGSVRAEISGKTVFLATYTQDGLTSISVSACNQTLCKSDSTTQTIRFPVAPGAPTPTATPPPATPVVPTVTPPAVGAALNCGYLIDTTTVAGGEAQVKCLAQTKESLTSFTFQTTDLTPGSTTLVSASSTDPTGARTYQFDGTAAPNDLAPTNQQATVTVGGKACTLTTCSAVSPAVLTIPYASVSLSVLPASVPLGTSVNLFAVITGPNGLVPAGGTVQFAAIDTSGSTPIVVPIGLEVKVSPVGGFAVANLTVPTGQMPLGATQTYKIIAVYSGGANMFGGTSPQQNLTVTPRLPDVCNGFDDNGNGQIDESCLVLGDSGVSDKDIGAAVILRSVAISSGQALSGSGTSSIVVSPGANLSVAGQVLLNTAQPETCIDCVRQVYFGVGENTAVFPRVAPVGPYCAMSQKLPDPAVNPAPVALPQSGHNFTIKAPTVPGIYYLRSTASIQANCGNPPVGGPDVSVARIVVQATTSIDLTQPANTMLGQRLTLTANITVPTSGASGALPGNVTFCDSDMPLPGPAAPGAPCGTAAPLGTAEVVSTTPPPGTASPTGIATLNFDTTAYYQSYSPLPVKQHHVFAVYNAYPGESAWPDFGQVFLASVPSIPKAYQLTPATTDVQLSLGLGDGPSTVALGIPVPIAAGLAASPLFGNISGSLEFSEGASFVTCIPVDQQGLVLGTLIYDVNNYLRLNTPVGTHSITVKYFGRSCGAQDNTPNHLGFAQGTGPSTGNYADSAASNAVTFTITKAATDAAISFSTPANSTNLTSPLTITVSLSNPTLSGQPFGDIVGSVQLTCDGNNLGAVAGPVTNSHTFPVDWTNVATACADPLAGQHQIGAVFSSTSAIYAGTTADPVGYAFTVAPTTLVLGVPGGGVALGSPAPLSATVALATGTGQPFGDFAGTIEFYEGTALLGTAPIIGSTATATLDFDTSALYGGTSPNPVGAHNLSAKFMPAAGSNYQGSTTAATTPLTINPERTSVAVSLSPAAVPLGALTTISAQVSAAKAFGPIAGNVQFFVDGTATGTPIAVSGTGVASAAFDTSLLYDGTHQNPVGSHSFTASYTGSAGGNYADEDQSASTAAALTLQPSSTTLTLRSDLSTAALGTTINLTTTMNGAFGDFGGKVQFMEGTNQIGCVDLTNTNPSAGVTLGSATLAFDTSTLYNAGTSPSPTGSHDFSASYVSTCGATPAPPTGNYGGDTSTTVNVLISGAVTTTAPVVPSLTSVNLGAHVTLTANVTTSANFGSLSGVVEFYEGTRLLGTDTSLTGTNPWGASLDFDSTNLYVAGGPSPIGTHQISAKFVSSADNYANSTSATTAGLTVDPVTTTLVVTLPVSTAALGSTVTLNAQLGHAGADFGPYVGSIQFFHNGATVGSPVPVSASGLGTMQFDTTTLYGTGHTSPTTESHVFSASFTPVTGGTYLGLAETGSTSAPLTLTGIPTNVTLTANPATATTGAPVTLTAQVSPNSFGLYTGGGITFRDGSTVLNGGNAVPLPDGTGQVTLTLPSVLAGSHNYIAHYDGNGNYGASTTDGAVTVSVLWPTQTAITVPSTPPTAGTGVTVTLSTIVSCPQCAPAATPSGIVEFFDGTTSLGQKTLTAGSAGITIPTTDPGNGDAWLPVGQHPTLAVRYYGGPNPTPTFAPSDSSLASLTVLAPTTTSISASLPTANPGSGSTLTVTVSSLYTGTDIAGHVEITDSTAPGSPRWANVALNKNGSNFEAIQVYTPPASDALGDRTFTAKFVPDTGTLFADSTTAAGAIVKVQHRTQVSLSVSPTTITWGQSSTLTATLQDTDASAPIPNAGSIEFYESVGGTGPKNTINTGTTDGTGVATYVYSPPGAQNEAVSAKFVPVSGSNYVGSAETSQTTIIVNQVQTTTSINATGTSVTYGTTVTISGRVITNPGGTGVTTGTVEIWDGGTQIGSSTLDSSGNYSYSTSTLAIQSHASHIIVAKFRNGGNYANSDSTNVGVIVNEISTSIVKGTVTYDAAKKASFTITINPSATGGGTLAGTITIIDGPPTSKINDTGTIDSAGALTTTGSVYQSPPLTSGTTYHVTITYTPNAGSNFAGSSTTIDLTPP